MTRNSFPLAMALLMAMASLLPCPVFADASDGEFLGYRLDQAYDVTASTQTSPSPAGNLQILAERPVMPADLRFVRLTTTVSSHTIGFIHGMQDFETEHLARTFAKKYYKLLRAKYPAWRIDTNEIELSNELRPIAVRMDLSPHTIRLKIDERPGANPYRVTITLTFLYDGPRWRTWTELARSERDEQQKTSDERLLEEFDTRGL